MKTPIQAAELLNNPKDYIPSKSEILIVVFDPQYKSTTTYSCIEKVDRQFGQTELDARMKAEKIGAQFYLYGKYPESVQQQIRYAVSESNRVEKLISLVEDTEVLDSGAIIWKTSKNCVPMDYFRDLDILPPAVQKEAISAQDKEAIQAYIESQRNRTPEQIAEEEASMRAAFGKGTTVVNVLTGKKTKL
ncbi:hypothetical protein QTV49_004329 [Vibrio vulnificus]|nr:hypothetical protein [Vibrio vulnificus]